MRLQAVNVDKPSINTSQILVLSSRVEVMTASDSIWLIRSSLIKIEGLPQLLRLHIWRYDLVARTGFSVAECSMRISATAGH